jgi:hypothetical protein
MVIIKLFLNSNILLNNSTIFNEIEYSSIDENTFIIPLSNNNVNNSLIEKIKKGSANLEKIGIWSDGVKVIGPAKDFAFQHKKIDDTFFPILLGKDIETALKWAPINSMSVVQYIGAQAGHLTITQIEEFLKNAPENYQIKIIE